jgi:hypothetical protein
LISVLISGCATSNAGFKYIEPSRKDVLSEGTKKQILEHNEFCEKQGNCTKPEK